MDGIKLLNKVEQRILSGKPCKPMSAYNIFIKEYCTDKSHSFKNAAECYRALSDDKRVSYKNRAMELRTQYLEEMKSFLDSLPPNSVSFSADIPSTIESDDDTTINTTINIAEPERVPSLVKFCIYFKFRKA